MSTDSFGDASLVGGQDPTGWSHLAIPSIASPSLSDASPGQQSAPSPSPSAASGSTLSNGKDTKQRRVANLLALTELRKAAWARIYASCLQTGDAAITTTHVPTWKAFDAVMIKRHRHIAVDPRDNRTLGWIACFQPHPLSSLYEVETTGDDGRGGCVAEVQVMVAEPERRRGVGTFLLNAILASLAGDSKYSKVQASWFPENEACRRLVERCGFEVVGTQKHAVRMIDGPRKGEWRDLVTAQLDLPPLQPPTPAQQQQPSSTATAPIAMDVTVDPSALFKRPRLD